MPRQQRKLVLVLVFVTGLLMGAIAGFLGTFIPYYRYHFVVLDGPAGVVARDYAATAAHLANMGLGRARTVQEIVDYDVRAAGVQSLLAASAYCAMNEGNRATTRSAAMALRASPYVQDALKAAGREQVMLSLDYLANAPDKGTGCAPFQPSVQGI